MGLPKNGVFSGGSIDSVQLANGNLHVDIPLLHLPGVGIDTDIHFVYDSQVFNITQVPGLNNTTWNLLTVGRSPARISDPLGAIMKLGVHQVDWECGAPYPVGTWDMNYIDYMSLNDVDGSAHSFPVGGYDQTQSVNGTLQSNVAPCVQNYHYFPTTSYSEDASGYQLTLDTAGDILSVKGKDGSRYTFGPIVNSGPVGTTSAPEGQNPEVSPTQLEYALQTGIEDSDGNRITGTTAAVTGCTAAFVITDTLGRTVTECPPPGNVLQIPYISLEAIGRQAQTIQYTDQTGATRTITLTYTSIPLKFDSICGSNCGPAVGNTAVGMTASVMMPTAITLRDDETYETYTINYAPNDLGEISSIVLPTGGEISYRWGTNPQNPNTGPAVISRTVIQNGQTSTWSYTYTAGSASVAKTTTVTDPNLNDTVYTWGTSYYPQTGIVKAPGPTQEVSYNGSQSTGAPLATKNIGYLCSPNASGCIALPTSEALTWNANGATTETDFTYDSETVAAPPHTLTPASQWSWGNIKSKILYDYGTGGTHGPLLSNTQYTYLHETNSAYVAPDIANRLAQTSVYNSTTTNSSTLVAQATVAYDAFTSGGQNGLAASGWSSNHDSAVGTGTTMRGLPTSTTKYVGPSTASITTYTNYNILGQPTVSTDGRSNLTTLTYTMGVPGSGNSDLLTITTMPPTTTNGTTYPHVIKQYQDPRTSLLMAKADQNGNFTYYTYDSLMRPLLESRPDTGTTTNSYPDANHINTVVTETSVNSSTTNVTLDGAGRKISTNTTSDSVCGPLTVDMTYDLLSRVQSVSNPHCSHSQSTDGVTTYIYDGIGRLTNKLNPDGSQQQWQFNGNVIDFWDENLNHWQHTYDAATRLVKVLEPNGTTTPNITPTMETDYAYDTLGDLLRVDQRGISGQSTDHVRLFAYDAVSRLIASNNPESASPTSPAAQVCTGAASGTHWTTCYTYDNNGNLTKKTDNRGISINYSYDADNRLLGKTYSDSTPAVTFAYDASTVVAQSPPNGPNLLGQLTQGTVTSGSTVLAKTTDYLYDPMGRLQFEQQCTPANIAACLTAPYEVDTLYDKAGKPTTETFPSNAPSTTLPSGQPLTVTYTNDAAERLISATSSWIAIGDTKHPDTLFKAVGNSGAPAYGPMGLMNASIGFNTAASSTTASLQRGYDNRGRTLFGAYVPGSGGFSESTSRGTIAISGSEGSVTKTAHTSSAIITITGSEGTHSVCTTTYVMQGGISVPITTCTQVPDTGGLAVSVLASPVFTASANFGSGSTDPAIAASLAAGFNVSASPVTATVSGNVITITSKATGLNANYGLLFNNGSDFFATGSGTMSGGVTAGTFYDSGTINVAVSGVMAQTTWGQGSTASGLAATLTALLNATEGSSGFFTASVSGGTITINSTGAGPDDDWAITANQTETNPTYFSTPTLIVTGTNGSGGAINNTNLLYAFNIPDVGGYAPNGNLLTATDTVMGQWNYSYDNLNRLITASAPTSQPTGVQAYYAGVNVGATAPTWAYDPFGNRTSETWTGVGSALVPTTSAVVFAAASNQTSTFNGTAYQHDAAGDVTYDGLNSYLYDAEGRLCAVKNQSGAMTGYVYDAGGIRVAKAALTSFSCNFASNGFPSTASWTGTSWVLGPGSEQVTEYSVSAGTSTWQHTNVFASGALLASYNGTDTYFALNDWLGTKRVELNATNTCETGFRSLQFGDGYASFPLSTSLPACVDATEQHFTGKDHDAESGNDYFDARYFSNAMGRFMSPDWSAKEDPVPYAVLTDPQSLNLYSYVRNNPLTRTDSDGHCDNNGQNCSLWDHFAGAVGGVLNVVPATVNLGVDAFNAVSSQFSGPQIDRMDMIQPDAHASMGGIQTGEALQVALPVGDMSKGAQILENAAAGKAFQEAVATETAIKETNVVQNVTIKTESGVKTVMDVVSKDSEGSVALREAKSSATARLTPNQATTHPEIARTGGTVVGKGKPGFPGGTRIPPTRVQVIRPKVSGS